ncbi:MAG: hypothetical protein Alpg2KO_14060 [Alphaproteobacteria bacterium]
MGDTFNLLGHLWPSLLGIAILAGLMVSALVWFGMDSYERTYNDAYEVAQQEYEDRYNSLNSFGYRSRLNRQRQSIAQQDPFGQALDNVGGQDLQSPGERLAKLKANNQALSSVMPIMMLALPLILVFKVVLAGLNIQAALLARYKYNNGYFGAFAYLKARPWEVLGIIVLLIVVMQVIAIPFNFVLSPLMAVGGGLLSGLLVGLVSALHMAFVMSVIGCFYAVLLLERRSLVDALSAGMDILKSRFGLFFKTQCKVALPLIGLPMTLFALWFSGMMTRLEDEPAGMGVLKMGEALHVGLYMLPFFVALYTVATGISWIAAAACWSGVRTAERPAEGAANG